MDDWKARFDGKTITVTGIRFRMRVVTRPDGSSDIAFDRIDEPGPQPQPIPRDPEVSSNVTV